MVFLKDYWCPNLEGIHPELETYARLRASHVRYVATALAGGVVFGSTGQPQTTVTQDILRLKPIPGDGHANTPPQAFHYRFVVREIGHPLETYESAGQLWDIVSDSLIGTSYYGCGAWMPRYLRVAYQDTKMPTRRRRCSIVTLVPRTS